jgi:hypothetical protein
MLGVAVRATELDTVLRHGPFHRALQLAIAERGLTLDQLRRRLDAHGVAVSAATLSYWQRGRVRPSRGDSLLAVERLETLLALPGGSLTRLLARGDGSKFVDAALWRDGERLTRLLGDLDTAGADRLARTSVHDHFEVDACGRERARWTRGVYRAVSDGADRVVVLFRSYHRGLVPELTEVRFCSIGRHVRDPACGLLAAELWFDAPLAEGEFAVIEYLLAYPGRRPPGGIFERRFSHLVGEYILQVSFDKAALPSRCDGFVRDTADGQPRRRQALRVGGSGSVLMSATGIAYGVCGIEARWD